MVMEGRELSTAEIEVELQKVVARLWERTAEYSTHRCKHGINLEKAGCWPCLEERSGNPS